jgi:hypothetical protein
MTKYVIKPLDKHGHPVMRAVTSINDDAADDQINEKVLGAVKRGGSKVVNVLCVNTLSEVVLAWGVTRDLDGLNAEIAPCDVEPFKTAPAEPTNETANADAAPAEAKDETEAEGTEESDMAKRKAKSKKGKKSTKVKKTKTARKAGGKIKSGSKTEIVAKLLQRASGCTKDDILKATGWKAVGVMQQAKVCGLKVKKEKEKGKPTRYFVK